MAAMRVSRRPLLFRDLGAIAFMRHSLLPHRAFDCTSFIRLSSPGHRLLRSRSRAARQDACRNTGGMRLFACLWCKPGKLLGWHSGST
jgi:hypothetical protein